jgi:hypothetical protein
MEASIRQSERGSEIAHTAPPRQKATANIQGAKEEQQQERLFGTRKKRYTEKAVHGKSGTRKKRYTEKAETTNP